MKYLCNIIVVFSFLTYGCFYDDGLLDEIKEEVEEQEFFDNAEIDGSVWERELPPYFDDTE